MNIYFDREPEPDYRFIAVNKGHVAIHPKPQGVIQFVGGFFFGGWFPQWWHKSLLRPLFEEKYTIIINGFANSSDHWSQAIKLIDFQQSILAEVKEIAKNKPGYDYHIYEQSPTSTEGNYFWLGHSLGCKYIALLELLTDLENKPIAEALEETFGKEEARQIQADLEKNDIDLSKVSLKNQPSILMAPVVNDLSPIARFFGLKIVPSKENTLKFIVEATQNNRNLFNLLSVISFQINNVEDNLAKETVDWIDEKIGGTDRLLTGKVQKIAISCPELSFLGPILGLLAHLVPVFSSEANDRELPTTILKNLKELREKYCPQKEVVSV